MDSGDACLPGYPMRAYSVPLCSDPVNGATPLMRLFLTGSKKEPSRQGWGLLVKIPDCSRRRFGLLRFNRLGGSIPVENRRPTITKHRIGSDPVHRASKGARQTRWPMNLDVNYACYLFNANAEKSCQQV